MAVGWEDEASRRAWRAYRGTGLRWCLAAVACAALLVGGVQVALAGSSTLLREGTPTVGTVTAADDTEVSFDYDADGQRLEQTLQITSGRGYTAGEQVEVRYDEDDPTVARLVEEPRRIPGLGLVVVGLAVVAATAAVIGVGVLGRARRWRQALGRASWTPARLRMAGIDVALTPSGAERVSGRLRTTTRWRTTSLQDLDGHELWLLLDRRELVLRVDGVDTLYGARRRD